MPQTVVILDPDDDFARMLAEQLGDAGLAATLVPDVASVMAEVDTGAVAALVLASSLPEIDIVALCGDLRARYRDIAIILLARTPDPVDLLEATGADEIFVRPIRLGALIGRLRGLLEPPATEIVEIGPYRFESAAKRLLPRAGGEPIHLTEKETEILRALARAGSVAVSREQLLSEVWRYNPEVTTHTLETHIYRLRQKMETAASPGPFLLTEAGGYRLELGSI